ncbi:MAG TPA: GspH/FimT family pseudopilin [Gemmatimonadaceae bacterium]|nr:GspH/FimT family pseudopilin [Gemmatimonadaceae bacterium]
MPKTRFFSPPGSRAGFNLIEVTVVLAIAGILSGITLPRAAGFLDRVKVRGAVTEIASLFSTARHAAISRASQVVLEIDPSTTSITLRAGPDTLQRREIGLVHGVALTTNRESITYSPMGTGYGAANFTMIVTRRNAADTIVVSRLGRVRY